MSPLAAATSFHGLPFPEFPQYPSLPRHHLLFPKPPFSPLSHPTTFLKFRLGQHYQTGLFIRRPQYSITTKPQEFSDSTYDRELRYVLELATDAELYELEQILFGTSYFSPLLKSIAKKEDIDYYMIGVDPEERDEYISMLEKRFLYLAADARSVLRGWRPSYRNILLGVRKKLNIPCSSKLATEDLEAEIFLHMLQDYSGQASGSLNGSQENVKNSDGNGTLEHGLSQWKVQTATALRDGAADLRSMILKGGGVLTLGKLYELLAKGLSGKMFQEAAKYQLKNELIKEGAKLAAVNLESRAALHAAKQVKSVAGAASRYLGIRSMMTLLGPMLWGTFLADVVVQMLGTDYARILRAIYALAQIRILHTK
ncbi:uncharacterized protein LOC113767519 isoform X1 [Coffea eugenioides]|uniref:uncharacterized protein LOC113767519 isoform X1 n=1 Tax=Coffea eugenioides TaxID=49369 RepID=UPI000F60E555|nr:uncharacterized protein LOC113767519 isoform X1 [Coffea eugenioides]